MTESIIQITNDGPIRRITLNREGRRNALTQQMILDLTVAVREAKSDESVRIVQIAAAGTVFCAGMDLAQMQQRAESPDAKELWAEDSRVFAELLTEMLTASQPIVAIMQGPVLAGGVGIVLACDLVLAADSAFVALPEPQRGITAAIVTPALVYRAGVSAASYLLLSGKRVGPEEAERLGLIHKVCDPEMLEEEASELSRSILSGSPQALATTKSQIRDTHPNLIEQINSAAAASASARETRDAREGLQAFLEKRKPNWQG